MSREPGFPPVVATVGGWKLWLDTGVKAHRAGETERRRSDAFAHRVLDSRQVADQLGVTKQMLDTGLRRKSASFPSPSGRLGRSPWWEARKFAAWLRAHPDRAARDDG